MPEAPPFRVTVTETPSAAAVQTLADAVGDDGVEIEFEIDELPPEAIAAFVAAVDEWLAAGRAVRLINAPQMLGHTLYKVGRLNHAPQLTVSVRATEPYAG